MPKGYNRAPAYDKSKGTVHIWSREGRVPGKLADLIPGDVNRQISSHSDKIGNAADGAPTLVDYFCVTRNPTAGDIRRAHAMGCEYGAIILPEQGEWLRPKIVAAVTLGDDITIWMG